MLARGGVPMACLLHGTTGDPHGREAKCWLPPRGQEEILWTYRLRNCGILEGQNRARGQGYSALSSSSTEGPGMSLHNRTGM